MSAVRRPSRFAPMAETSTGTAAPMPMPMIIGKAVANEIVPVTESACKIPTEAELDCKTAVMSVPMRTPRIGFSNIVIRRRKSSLSRSGDTAPLIAFMPYIKTAKPSRISPVCRFCDVFPSMRSSMPAMAAMAVIVAELRRESASLLLIYERQRIQPVTDVPMFAPSTMPIACESFIMPEFTKPTTIADVAEDDWITAVTAVPSSTPLSGVLESR